MKTKEFIKTACAVAEPYRVSKGKNSPGGEKTWHADHYHMTRQGPAFRADPEGAVGMLSQALADLSRQIAAAVPSVSASQRESKPAPSP
jgi:hypothetical protein